MKIEKIKNFTWRTAFLSFSSNKSIEEVGEIISTTLFPSFKFGDKFMNDELPAISIPQILGLSIIIVETESYYSMKIYEKTSLRDVDVKTINKVDISLNVHKLLKNNPELNFIDVGSKVINR